MNELCWGSIQTFRQQPEHLRCSVVCFRVLSERRTIYMNLSSRKVEDMTITDLFFITLSLFGDLLLMVMQSGKHSSPGWLIHYYSVNQINPLPTDFDPLLILLHSKKENMWSSGGLTGKGIRWITAENWTECCRAITPYFNSMCENKHC